MEEIRLDFALHTLVCPHCQQQTHHAWPGATILFAPARCEQCAREFLIVQNKPWLDDIRLSEGREPARPTNER